MRHPYPYVSKVPPGPMSWACSLIKNLDSSSCNSRRPEPENHYVPLRFRVFRVSRGSLNSALSTLNSKLLLVSVIAF